MDLKLGTIKWYGDRHGKLKYGFISELNGEDYHFTEQSCDWDVDPRDERSYVIFKEAKRSRPGRRAADAVTILSRETDAALVSGISDYLTSPYSAGVWQHLRKVRNPEELLPLYKQLSDRMPDQSIAIAALPRECLIGLEGAEYRQRISPEHSLRACLITMTETIDSEADDQSIVEEAILHLGRLVSRNSKTPGSGAGDAYIGLTLGVGGNLAGAMKRIAMAMLALELDDKNERLSFCTERLTTDDIIDLRLTTVLSERRLASALHALDERLVRAGGAGLFDGRAKVGLPHPNLAWATNLVPAAIKLVKKSALGNVWPLLNRAARIAAWAYLSQEEKVEVLDATSNSYFHDTDGNSGGVLDSATSRTEFIAGIDPQELTELLPLLSSAKRVAWFIQLTKPTQATVWACLEGAELLLALHAQVASGSEILELFGANTPEPIVKYASIATATDKDAAFGEFHESLMSWAITKALQNAQPVLLDEYLPSCPLRVVQYCEGRPWPTYTPPDGEEGSHAVAFCPRTRHSCMLIDAAGSGHAHITPTADIDLKHYSLLEYFDWQGVKPAVDGLRNPDEYTNKLSGWVNRLNEIRERLKCTQCGSIMTGNMKYAKNLARYSMTVASCHHGNGHDVNVYLNHCWNCYSIIDSRESRLQVNNYYLCIHCGAADPNMTALIPGDMCPSCGNKDKSKLDSHHRHIHCRQCGHTFLNKRPKTS